MLVGWLVGFEIHLWEGFQHYSHERTCSSRPWYTFYGENHDMLPKTDLHHVLVQRRDEGAEDKKDNQIGMVKEVVMDNMIQRPLRKSRQTSPERGGSISVLGRFSDGSPEYSLSTKGWCSENRGSC
eukprot:TRINITY_DN10734_c0_g2_i9.p1 TRINITY_DN10734_c0_g2~~TRINITY_DN10734_c0_g2_i9.p1  ORF type:complete len:126 (-),score=13.51 TRINITY_DN10734_c0_g2_i9:75-452(-)